MKRLLTGLAVILFAVNVFSQNNIETVNPNSADPGTSGLLVTFTVPDTTPPTPPVEVVPTSVTIGTMSGSSITRVDMGTVTAVFNIPSNEPGGAKDCSIIFPGPQGDVEFTKTGGFTVTSAEVSIDQQPSSISVLTNSPVTLSVSASGEAPLSYQWKKDSSNIGGATSDIYSISSAQVSDSGDYTCVVSNSHGFETSAVATVTVYAELPQPSLTYTIVDTAQDVFFDNSTEISEPSPGQPFYGQDASHDGNQPSYITSADGKTVYDINTGLTWTQSPDWTDDGTIDVNDKMNQSEAAAYVATVNAANFGGYNDWRLPSIKEVYSLMDFRGTDPMSDDTSTLIPFINSNYFDFAWGDTNAVPAERTIDSQVATTSVHLDEVLGGEVMSGLNIVDGRIKGYPVTKDFLVYLCRGNTNYGANVYADNGDGTVTDSATGLMWAQDDSGFGMLWSNALSYVQQMNASNHLGYSDWRLPNAKEMQSIVDYGRSPGTGSAAIDPIFNCTTISNEAGEIDWPWYFTGTTHLKQDGSGAQGVYVCFGRAMGYFQAPGMQSADWIDVHGSGAQRSNPKVYNTAGNTYEPDGWYATNSPQGDAIRWTNYVRLVRDADLTLSTEPAVYYVDADTPAAANAQDGIAWDTAFEDLQDALALATTQEIWVAAGTYYPDEAAAGYAVVTNDNPDAAFYLIDGVELYGGFAGTETNRTARDPDVNVTILSGDIGQDDTNDDGDDVADTYADIQGTNAYHVVSIASGVTTLVIDGVTITAGYANGGEDDNYGAGIYNMGSGVSITHCRVEGNFANERGGGLYSGAASGQCRVADAFFSGNRTGGSGGAIYGMGECDISSSTFSNNVALTVSVSQQDGAGVYLDGCPSFVISDSGFYWNRSDDGGSGLYVNSTSGRVERCVFAGNWAEIHGGGVYLNASTVEIEGCRLTGNRAGQHGGGLFLSESYTHVAGSTLSGNQTSLLGGGIGLFSDSSADLYNTIIWQNSALNATTGTSASVDNYSGTSTVYNCLIENSGGSTGWDAEIGTDMGGNLDNDPLFILGILPDRNQGGDFRLDIASPCINAGTNSAVTVSEDLDGNTRIYDTTVDIGCYETIDDGTDSDNDSLTDYEERVTYGSDPDLPDTDGDGMDDGDEVVAGTEPGSASSVLKLTTSEVWTAGIYEYIDIEWPSVSGRTYFIESCTNLASGVWEWRGMFPTHPSTNSATMMVTSYPCFFRVSVTNAVIGDY